MPDLHPVVVCPKCRDFKTGMTSAPDEPVLAFECRACGFAWVSANLPRSPSRRVSRQFRATASSVLDHDTPGRADQSDPT